MLAARKSFFLHRFGWAQYYQESDREYGRKCISIIVKIPDARLKNICQRLAQRKENDNN